MLLAISWPISFDQPEWLWLMLTIPVIVAISMRSLAGLDRPRRIVAVALRSVVIVLLAIALARVQLVKRNDHVAVMFVLDKSHSIPDDLRLAAQNYIKQVTKNADRDDRFGVISFDGQADVDLIPSRGGAEVFGFSLATQADRTNLAEAIRLALAVFPEGFARRVVLLTDGNQNVEDLTGEIEIARANKVAVDVVPLQYHYDNEILFDRIVVRAKSSRDTKIPVRLIVKSRKPARVRLSLYHNDVEVPLADPVLVLGGNMRPEPFTIPIELQTGGIHRFDARLTPIPIGADSIPENNRATTFTFVEDQGRVLILSQAESNDDRVLYEALIREKIDVELRSIDQISIDPLKLEEYGAIILANISADEFTEQQHRALANYVASSGGGLIMTGGNEGFGAGGWIGTPIEEVSPVSFKIPNRKVIPSAALVIVLDKSGSMGSPVANSSYNQQEIANQSAILALRTLVPQDYVGLVAFDGGYDWVVKLQMNTRPRDVARKIRTISPGGGTDIYPALEQAYKVLIDSGLNRASVKHVILLTDGQSQAGPYDQLIGKMVVAGITLSTIGVGDGANNTLLRKLAYLGKGKYHQVRNPKLLPQIFFRETRILRKRLIVDSPFSPQLLHGFSAATAGLSDSEIPSLGGFVRTRAKPDSVVPIVRRGKDGDDPILAHWNYEMGKMAVFTSGWWPKWGAHWAGWDKFGTFWAQLVRWAVRQGDPGNFDVITRLDGNRGKVLIEALDKDASYLNTLTIHYGRVLAPSMEEKPLYLTHSGPGRYEADFEVSDQGNYLVYIKYSYRDSDLGQTQQGLIRTGLSVSYSPEYRELGTNMTLLEQVVEQTGGRMLAMDPMTDKVFSRDLPPSVSRQPIWRWVVQWLLLPLFLLDVASRRLASTLAMSIYVEAAVFVILFAVLYTAKASPWAYVGALILAELVGWAIRWRFIVPVVQFFTANVTGLARAGQRSVGTLAQLKGVREKTREGLEAQPPDIEESESLPRADSKSRFDVGDEAGAELAGDLTAALDGASIVEKKKKLAAQQPKKDEKQEEDLTSRLLKAKHRARKEMKDHDQES